MTDAIQKAREAARKAYDEVSGNPTCDDPIGVAVDAALAALDAETDFKFHHAKDNIQDKENDHGSMGNAAFGICSGDGPNARGVDSVAVSRLAALDAETPATPADVGEEPVAWRWKAKDAEIWIYDPADEWLRKQSDDEIDREPLYSATALERVVMERDTLRARLETVEEAVNFVARWAWRTDPPNANNKLSDAERLSCIKHYPTIRDAAKPHIELAEAEASQEGSEPS